MLTYFIYLILLVLAQFADYVTTVYALAHGGREANPFVQHVGLIPSKLLGIGLSVLVLTLCQREWQRLVFTIAVCLVFGAVAIHNYWVAQ